MTHYAASLTLNARSCVALFAQIAEAMRRRPELRGAIKHFLFNEHGMRPGLYVLTAGADVQQGQTLVTYQMVPTDSLLQFAHAVSQGLIPDMPLPDEAGGA